jgi:putative membrane protein
MTMMWSYGFGMGGWGYALLGAGAALLCVMAVLVEVALVRDRDRDRDREVDAPDTHGIQPDPGQILADRFARGEIDDQEYRLRLEVLRERPTLRS